MITLYVARIFILLLMMHVVNLKGDNLNKVISASKTEDIPVIDGILDDKCWLKADKDDNFITIDNTGKYACSVRFLQNKGELYMAVVSKINEPEKNVQIIENIKKQSGFKKGFLNDRTKFSKKGLCLEIFFCPTGNGSNIHKFLANAAGQMCGNLKWNWTYFKKNAPRFSSVVDKGHWSLEIAFPVNEGFHNAKMHPGQTWLFSLIRYDNVPTAFWNGRASNFGDPNTFGRLLVGDYKEWWSYNGEKGLRKDIKDCFLFDESLKDKHPELKALYLEACKKAKELKKAKDKLGKIKSNDDFLKLNEPFKKALRTVKRLKAYARTIKETENKLK